LEQGCRFLMLSQEELIAFEERIAKRFNNKEIKAPVHLYSNCEEQMLAVFQHIKPDDWVCCTWRSHYQCLLKGVPEEELTQAILDGKSISLCFPKHRVISSGIVGGIIPIALGIALAIKRRGSAEHVWCWLGDMSAKTGIANECAVYAENLKLPITWVIEDNGISVCTPTRFSWGEKSKPMKDFYVELDNINTIAYSYQSKYPHAGAGERVNF
jgi:TPP-dependent pyruvate/acetoin dehydrogenase alpha subunit